MTGGNDMDMVSSDHRYTLVEKRAVLSFINPLVLVLEREHESGTKGPVSRPGLKVVGNTNRG